MIALNEAEFIRIDIKSILFCSVLLIAVSAIYFGGLNIRYALANDSRASAHSFICKGSVACRKEVEVSWSLESTVSAELCHTAWQFSNTTAEPTASSEVDGSPAVSSSDVILLSGAEPRGEAVVGGASAKATPRGSNFLLHDTQRDSLAAGARMRGTLQ